MKEDDGAVIIGRRRVSHDLVDAGPAPVPAVEIGQDREVAPVGDPLEDLHIADVEGARRRRIRRAEQPDVAAGGAGEDALAQRQLEVDPPGGQGRQLSVVVGVGADLVAGGDHRPHQVRMGGDLVADDEEGGADAVTGQDVQHGRGPLRVRPVVERQDDGLRRRRHRLHLVAAEIQHRPSRDEGLARRAPRRTGWPSPCRCRRRCSRSRRAWPRSPVRRGPEGSSAPAASVVAKPRPQWSTRRVGRGPTVPGAYTVRSAACPSCWPSSVDVSSVWGGRVVGGSGSPGGDVTGGDVTGGSVTTAAP